MKSLPQAGIDRDMSDSRFIGTWRLVSQQGYDADGTLFYPRTENAAGILMYDGYGNMAVQLMRPDHQSGDLADFSVAMEDFLAYYGTYHVDEEAGIMTHDIEGCSFPGWIGTEQERQFSFEGDRLTLHAEIRNVDGTVVTHVLVWQRVG